MLLLSEFLSGCSDSGYSNVTDDMSDETLETRDSSVLRLSDILPPHVSYDKSKPPTFRQHPAVVFLHITVLMLDSFDQNEMTFTTGINMNYMNIRN